MGYLSDEEVIKRSHWSVRRQTKYGAQVFKTMVENDEVKKLWRDFHFNLRTARESTVCFFFLSFFDLPFLAYSIQMID